MKPNIQINELERFFLKCSGTSYEYIKEYGIPTEVNKGVGIGATVLLTGIFAMVSFGYAMSWVFQNIFICIILGFLWGVSIFNLDRFIVSATYKGKTFSMTNLFQTIIRFGLAVGIAFTIAIPIELKLFEDELLKESARYHIERETKTAKAEREEAYVIYRNEVEGNGTGAIKSVGEGPIARALKKEFERLDRKVSILESNVRSSVQNDSKYIGLLGRYRALEYLKETDGYIRKIAFGITLLFIIIETMPVIIKLTTSRGVYDEQISFAVDHALTDLSNNRDQNNINSNLQTKGSKSRKTTTQSMSDQVTLFFTHKVLDIVFTIIVATFGLSLTKDISTITIASILAYFVAPLIIGSSKNNPISNEKSV